MSKWLQCTLWVVTGYLDLSLRHALDVLYIKSIGFTRLGTVRVTLYGFILVQILLLRILGCANSALTLYNVSLIVLLHNIFHLWS